MKAWTLNVANMAMLLLYIHTYMYAYLNALSTVWNNKETDAPRLYAKRSVTGNVRHCVYLVASGLEPC